MNKLKVFQVYFNDEQLPLNYIPYFNENCTPYFENKVIVELIEKNQHQNCTHFGVLSHQFEAKIKDRMSANWDGLKELKNHHRFVMDANGIEHALKLFSPSVLALMQHPAHDPIAFGGKFHAKLPEFFTKITKKIGCEWKPQVFNQVYYSNYFIAEPSIYSDYVKTMLAPAIEVMESMDELWQPSGYPKELPKRLQKQWGVDYYPYHTFVLERLFSYYCHLNKDKIWPNQPKKK